MICIRHSLDLGSALRCPECEREMPEEFYGEQPERILKATLPSDGDVGQVITLGPNVYATTVNGHFHIPPMERHTFTSYRWPWPFNKTLRWKNTFREAQA